LIIYYSRLLPFLFKKKKKLCKYYLLYLREVANGYSKAMEQNQEATKFSAKARSKFLKHVDPRLFKQSSYKNARII
jgi:hypothetical protein